MTVKQLITRLKKMPQDLQVYSADHDHGSYETSAKLSDVCLIDKSKMTELDNDKCSGLDDCFTHTPQVYVCLRN